MQLAIHIARLIFRKTSDGTWHLTKAITVRECGSMTEAGFEKLKDDCADVPRPSTGRMPFTKTATTCRVSLTAIIESDAEANSEKTKKQFDTSSQAVVEVLRKAVGTHGRHYGRERPADYLDDGDCPPWV